jgi:hypothetical protein
MADLSSLVNFAASNAGKPQNPLASLMPNGGQLAPPVSAPPMPTHEQAMAGYHRMQETKRLMGNILRDPRTGKQNIRPLVMDAGAALIGERLQSLAEFMAGIATFPPADDPLGQKQWVRRLCSVSDIAQRKLLADHRAANAPDWQHGTPWSADNHSQHMAALMAHYPSQN